MSRPDQAQLALSPITPLKLFDPAVSGHDVESARESGAVHRQNLSQLSLTNCSGKRQGLQDCELRWCQTEWTQRFVVVLRESP